MTTLNDTQLILLSTASQRDGRNLFPLPRTLADGTDRVGKAIAALVKHGLVEERETTERSHIWRTYDHIRFGVYITDTGIAAIDGEVPLAPTAGPTHRVTKTSIILDLLNREQGATLIELIDATNWLPHTTRAALTGLRKKGHAVERVKRADATCYRIAGAA